MKHRPSTIRRTAAPMLRAAIPDALRPLRRGGLAKRLARTLRGSTRALGRAREAVAPLDATGLDDVLADLAGRAVAEAGPATVTAQALRLRSPDLVAVLRHVGLATGRPRWELGAATALAGLGDPDSRARSLTHLLEALARHGTDPFEQRQQLILAQLLFLAGRGAELTDLLPRLERIAAPDGQHLRTDLVNPRRLAAAQDTHSSWVAQFTDTWSSRGLIPPTVDVHRPGNLFDALDAQPEVVLGCAAGLPERLHLAGLAPGVLDRLPLVSVVVPTFRPDEGLPTAVRSLARQTWPRLEILLVDDASGPACSDLIAEAAALDDRVRVFTQPENGGSYVARNRAMAAARGEFLTCHDADDWAHPQRIEHQVLPLLLDPDLPATHSLAMRAHDDLTRQWLGYPAIRVNASSLAFRTDLVEAVGPFDPVRKSGDSEFAARLTAITGRQPQLVPEVLAITRLRTTSLSRGDFSMGWARAARIGYQGGYRNWHRRLADGHTPGAAPDLVAATAEGRRPFAAPRSYLPGGPAPVPAGGADEQPDAAVAERAFDVLLVADLCQPEAAGVPLVDLVTGLTGAGLVVAVLHQEDPFALRRTRLHVHGALQDLLEEGCAVQVHPEEPIAACLVGVLSPSCVMLTRDVPQHLVTDRVWVRLPEGAGLGGEQHRRVLDHLARWTDAPVTLGADEAPDTPRASRMLRQLQQRLPS